MIFFEMLVGAKEHSMSEEVLGEFMDRRTNRCQSPRRTGRIRSRSHLLGRWYPGVEKISQIGQGKVDAVVLTHLSHANYSRSCDYLDACRFEIVQGFLSQTTVELIQNCITTLEEFHFGLADEKRLRIR